jgi:zinc transporter
MVGSAMVSLHTSDSRGLVWGYQLASARPLRLTEPLPEGPLWLHFNLADARARTWLAEESGLGEDAIATLLEPQPRAQLELIPGGVCGIVEDLHHDFRGDPEGFGELRFVIDDTRVISARRHPLKAVDLLHRRLERGEPIEDTAVWLDEFVEALTQVFHGTVQGLADQVDALEDEIVGGASTQGQRASLAALRRLIVRFRRHVSANRTALARLRARPLRRADDDATRHSLEHLDGVSQDLELVHERVRLLQEEVASRLAEATNRNLYVLSIVTTALLPATLVTGLWGMNVGGMPWADDPLGFLWTTLVVLSSIGLALLLLRGSKVV